MWKKDHSLEVLMMKWTLGFGFTIVTAVFILKISLLLYVVIQAKLAGLVSMGAIKELIELIKFLKG